MTFTRPRLRRRFSAQKLEAVSRLSGEITHDFNNILTMVLGDLALVKLSSGLEKEAEERITAAEKAILSAKGMTQQLLTFSRGGAPIKKTIEANRFIGKPPSFPREAPSCRAMFLSPLRLSGSTLTMDR